MPLLPFKGGIQVVYIVRLKWGYSCLVEVGHYLTRFGTYIILDQAIYKEASTYLRCVEI